MNPEKLEARRKAQKEQKELERIEQEKNQNPVKSIIINIEWKKSRMWGYNPRCEAKVEYQDGTGGYSPTYTCSGGGYDKESTVIADVFNTYLKYRLWQKAKDFRYNQENHSYPYGIYLPRKDYNHVSFQGGVGTNCYYSISKFIGGKFEHISGGKTFDVYKFTMIN